MDTHAHNIWTRQNEAKKSRIESAYSSDKVKEVLNYAHGPLHNLL